MMIDKSSDEFSLRFNKCWLTINVSYFLHSIDSVALKMSDLTPAVLTKKLVQLNLLDQYQVDQAWSEVQAVNGDCEELFRLLVRKQLLTNLQVERLKKGETAGYFYGQYKVLYLIGMGSFARVYRAVHRQTGQVAAVKVLRSRHRGGADSIDQFMREAKVGLKLKHKNIVEIYEVDPDPRSPYMVMEFVEGQTLRELVKVRRKLDPLTSLKLIADVARGLAYAASMGISHRDMKLSNVLVTSKGEAKLVDFGLAALSDTSNEQAIADCPNARAIDYAALERGTGVRRDDPRSDLFFLGCMLYHCLAGEAPMPETKDRFARLNTARFQEIRLLSQAAPEVPLNVAAVCHKAIEYDPTKRYQTANQMLQDLEATITKVEAGDTQTSATASSAEDNTEEDASNEGQNRTIMLIESKIEFQDLIRDKLKKRGYRVLVFSDPLRALSRFSPDQDPPADCLVFSAPELGAAALDAFNKLATDDHTKNIPAVMLVDRKQQFIIQNAKVSKKHVLLAMPLKVRDLRATLLKLLAGNSNSPSS